MVVDGHPRGQGVHRVTATNRDDFQAAGRHRFGLGHAKPPKTVGDGAHVPVPTRGPGWRGDHREAKHTVATVTDGEQPQVTHLSLDPCPSGSGHRRQAIDGNAFALAQLQTRRPTAHDIPHQIEPIAAGLIKNHRWPLAMRGDHAVR